MVLISLSLEQNYLTMTHKFTMQIHDFFQSLWHQYIEITPQALFIENLFKENGETVINDHVAFRTFDRCSFDLQAFKRVLKHLGYHAFDEYKFPLKHLDALAFKHESLAVPKIFVSEIKREKLSQTTQELLEKLIVEASISELQVKDLWAGRRWSKLTFQEYQGLAQESEYAAWLATMGLRANHFTISVNHLSKYKSLEAVNRLLVENGIELNQVGGVIKGSPQVYLAQSSTIADQKQERFTCGMTASIPTCFYEFAIRYNLPSGDLFSGFVTNNASRIFDSTHRQSSLS